MDTYATSVQQIGPTLTPQMLSQKFLVRPYRRDLYRLRIIYIWIIQNIAIIDQRTGQQQQGGDNKTTTSGINQQQQQQQIASSKISFRQRFSARRNTTLSSYTDHDDELEPPTMDVMHGDGLLPEGGTDVDSFDDWLYSESAQQVLLHRACSSSIGMANLFCEMATAAGFHDARVVYGYLRAPKDSLGMARMDLDDNDDLSEDNCTLIQNHAWCCVKVEGEYRFVDCWLASSFQPQNKSKMEPHWFLTKPTDMIYTHFPQEPVDQCLEPTITVSTFFALPYVWASFFSHHIKMIRYNPNAIHLVDDQVCHLTFRVDMGTICFAYVEVDNNNNNESSSKSTLTTLRCLAQSRMIPDENGQLQRIYKIKAVLPPGHDHGWLKVYAGPSSCYSTNTSPPTRQENISNGTSLLISRHLNTNTITTTGNTTTTLSSPTELPPLAMCFRLTAQQQQHPHQVDRHRPFEFVHLHPCRHEFYIREPQCYQLYPLQTYNFLIRGDDTHHKLAIKSPSGKLYKLMYYPQEHTYDGSVKISESGKWSLISLLHHAGGWYVVATWECRG
ncbi:hypothetical protein BC941DRAFT_428603 [Chlamydoabsidia padenii]|nr:hypothetical protein BC941DRAFT_428603 [Chlamydoabsidia padenii]